MGSLYVTIRKIVVGASTTCNVYRSNGAAWSAVDSAHAPNVATTVAYVGPTVLTIAYADATSGAIQFQDFDLVAQAWGAAYGIVAGAPLADPLVLLIRSTGDKVVIANTTPVQAYVYAGGAWSAPIDLTTFFPVGWPSYAQVSACIDATDTIHIFGYNFHSFYEQLLSLNTVGGFQDLDALAYVNDLSSTVIFGNSVVIGAMDPAQTYAAALTGTPLAAPVFALANCDPAQPTPAQNPTQTFVATDGANLWAAFMSDVLTLIAPFTYNWITQFRLALLTPLGWTGAGIFNEKDYPTSQKPFAFTGLAGIIGGYPYLNAEYSDGSGSGLRDAYFLAPYNSNRNGAFFAFGAPVTVNSGGGGGGSAGGRCSPCTATQLTPVRAKRGA